MMKWFFVVVLLTLTGVAALATSAMAECAWVLWHEDTIYEYPPKGLPKKIGPWLVAASATL